MSVSILRGDCRDMLRQMPDESVHCVVTSPPYWGLRDYGVVGQLGMEASLGEYLAVMVEVFREVRRVLRKDGTLWLNLGDSYAASVNGRSAADTKAAGNDDRTFRDKPFSTIGPIWRVGSGAGEGGEPRGRNRNGLDRWQNNYLQRPDIFPIKAGCPKDGTVLDPFAGPGTTGLVADRLQRNAILIELNPTYADMSQRRIKDDAPLFADVDDYNPEDDFARSIEEAYRVIRERKANGGKGWGGWE